MIFLNKKRSNPLYKLAFRVSKYIHFQRVCQRIIRSGLLLPLAFVINFLIHLPFMDSPPQSVHLWRQCNTLAVADNFYFEEMNIFKTRVDNRHATDGITGSHFPAYEYGLACLYKITGKHDWTHRYYSLILFYAGAIGLYYLLSLLFANSIVASIGAISYLFAPELFYHQINALPDILALTASIWGFYLFIYWYINHGRLQHTSRILLWFGATVCTLLAGLTKLQYLAIGFPIAVFFIMTYPRYGNIRILLYSTIYGSVATCGSLYWYARAIRLIQESGLPDFGIEFRPETNFHKGVTILINNISSFLPETLLNYASFILLIIGSAYIFINKKYKTIWFIPFLIYAAFLIIYHLVELRQMEHHGYYMMPYYIILLTIAGYGGAVLFQKGQYILLVILIIAQPFLASIRILPARWLSSSKGVSRVLLNPETREKIIKSIPQNALTIAGPDISNCILFYFSQTQGFGFSNTEILLDTNKRINGTLSDIELYTRQGATYLLVQEPSEEVRARFTPYVEKLLFAEDDIIVAKLKSSKE